MWSRFSIRTLFKPHHTMERNLAIIAFSLLLIVGILISSFHTYRVKSVIQLSNSALITTVAQTSVRQIEITIDNVYLSDDRTSAFILLKSADNSSSRLSSDASDYVVYATSLSGKPAENIKQVGVYCFGISGYIGLYIFGTEPFDSSCIKFIIRDNSYDVSDDEAATVDTTEWGDVSYAQYDQFTFQCNLGAKSADTCTFLNSEDPATKTIKSLYSQTVVTSKENTIRETLATDLETLKDAMDGVIDTETKMSQYGITNPNSSTRPTEMHDDEIVENTDGTLYLKSSYVVPGGVNFVWQDSRISDGYLKSLSGDQDVQTYLASIKSQKADDAVSKMTIPTIFEGTTANGTYTVNTASSDASNANALAGTAQWDDIQTIIQDYQTALSTYYTAKVQYETVDLISLLDLEYDTENAAVGFSSADNAPYAYY